MSNKLPWDKFTYSDWIGDVKLQMCSYAAQGLWMSMLCVLWDSEERGRLVCDDGSPMPIKMLSFVLRHSADEVQTLVTELIDGGVCSVGDDGVIYCRRMVREQSNREAETARNRQWRASKSTATTMQRQCNDNATTMQRQCNAIEREGEGELDKEKNSNSISERVESIVTVPVDNSQVPVDNSQVPVDNSQVPVDNSQNDGELSLSNSFKDSSFSDQTERLAILIETAHQFGECNDIGGVVRRNAIRYQSEAFPSSDTSVWFDAITEAITTAKVGTREGDIVTALRKYPDGILDNGNVSRCDELIRLTAHSIKSSKCKKALGYLPDRRKRMRPV